MKTDVLFVTSHCPWPIRGGQYIRCYNMILALSEFFNLAVLAPKPRSECEVLRRVAKWMDMGELATDAERFQYKLIPHPGLVGLLHKAWESYRPRLVWFDSGHWGNYVFVTKKYGSRTIMGTHNFQSELRRQEVVTARNRAQWIKLWLFFLAERLHERALFRFFDKVVSVSDLDSSRHSRFVGAEKCRVVPNFVDDGCYAAAESAKREQGLVTMTGNFTSFQNNHGAEWFIREVWPLIVNSVAHARLELVGRGSHAFALKVGTSKTISGIGEVDSVVPYLGEASVVAVPIKQGSGTRYKIIEALACRVPVVSTTLGAEGLDLRSGESCLMEDSVQGFADAIVSLLRDRDLGARLAMKGHEVFCREYTLKVNALRLRDIVLDTIGEKAKAGLRRRWITNPQGKSFG